MSDTLVAYSANYGSTWAAYQTPGTSPGTEGGFDAQRSGTNQFAAASGIVARATALGGPFATYYSPTGGAQAACIIIPYFTWAGVRQTAAANPDILVGLDRADGSSRTLLWIEGGATPGTVHDLTPAASFIFANPNALTSAYQHHIACFGAISSIVKLYRTTNQGGAWSLISGVTAPTFIRTRRNDTAGATNATSKGQVWIADSSLKFSSTWLAAAPSAHTMPGTITGLEPIY